MISPHDSAAVTVPGSVRNATQPAAHHRAANPRNARLHTHKQQESFAALRPPPSTVNAVPDTGGPHARDSGNNTTSAAASRPPPPLAAAAPPPAQPPPTPPRGERFLLDMYSQSFDMYATPAASFLRSVPVASAAPSDFASRFRSRPTTRLKVIGFDGRRIPSTQTHAYRTLDGFFPPVKLRLGESAKNTGRTIRTNRESSSLGIELAPYPDGGATVAQCRASPGSRQELPSATHSALKPRTHSSKSLKSTASRVSDKSQPQSQHQQQKTSTTPGFGVAHQQLGQQHIAAKSNHKHVTNHVTRNDSRRTGQHVTTSSDKSTLPTKEVPWIYRYKIKKKMNQLSKIMASKPPPSTDDGATRTVIEFTNNGVFPYIGHPPSL